MVSTLEEIVRAGELPDVPDDLLAFLLDNTGSFISQEGQTWDFKESWPFSYSDSYFGGICRLICGFANTYGGLIIFGVDDKTRKGGRTKVNPNVDRLAQAFQQLTGDSVKMVLRRYDHNDVGSFEVLLVAPIQSNQRPLRFASNIGSYPTDVIWVRQGHEVVAAEPRHIATLYCRRDGVGAAAETDIEGKLPPSPATLKQFVGRVKTIDEIFDWLIRSDEPRTFLFGKGGSGKSTIAYEIVKTLKAEGSGFRLNGGQLLETVIYLSAKQQALDTQGLERLPFQGRDFADERELYEALLLMTDADCLPSGSWEMSKLKEGVKKFFQQNAALVVIDDIDTLTTQGLEAGFDFLFGVLCRAQKTSKILYTLRNVPTQSLANSIEVPGLPSGEYEQFVELCASQFRVPAPTKGFVAGRLAMLSERRPLVIESIIALRRHCGSFEGAADLFEGRSGDNVREYVFEREWNAVPVQSRGRELLAILSLHPKPLAFSDLAALTQLDPSRVRDALAAVQEMFLNVDQSATDTTYQLGELTRAFVIEASKQLDFYETIKTRVEKFIAAYYPDNPRLSLLASRAKRLVSSGRKWNNELDLLEAWQLVNGSFEPAIAEDPRYHALRGYVASVQLEPRLNDAREAFERSFSMRYSPDVYYVEEWFRVERDSDTADAMTARITDLVGAAKGYDEAIRTQFISMRAAVLYRLAREGVHVEPTRSQDRLKEALRLHLISYRSFLRLSSASLLRSEEYSRNTAYTLIQHLTRAGRPDDMIDVLTSFCSEGLLLDPLDEPIRYFLESVVRAKLPKAEAHRMANRFAALSKALDDKRLWSAVEDSQLCAEVVTAAVARIKETIRK